MRCSIIVLFIVIPLAALANHVKYIVENNNLFKHNNGNSVSDGAFRSGREYWLNEEIRVVLQQSVNVPNVLIQGERLYMKQYSRWRGIELGRQLFTNQKSPWSNYLALDIGTLGLCGHIDGQALRLLEERLQRQNVGAIETRLRSEFCVNAQWWTKYNWNIYDFITIVPRLGMLAGTLQDAAEAGCTLKLGWNAAKYKDAATGNSIFSIGDYNRCTFLENLVACGFAGGSYRYYLYNHFLERSLFRDVKDTYSIDLDSNSLIGEICFGVHIEAYGIFMTWYGVMRTQEYGLQNSTLNYGGLNVGYRWTF